MTDVSGIEFAHYIYLPTEDNETIKGIWDRLAQRFSLNGKTPDDLITGGKALSFNAPVVVRNDHVALGLLISKGITAIEIIFPLQANRANSPEEALSEARRELSDYMSYAVGETTVAVKEGPNGYDPSKNPRSPLAKPSIFECGIKGASITIIHPEAELERYYVLERQSDTKVAELLLSRLPLIDGLSFKLARQADYFKDQRDFIRDKKLEADKGLSNILNKWSGHGTSEQKIDLLEKDIEALSAMYGELVGSLKMVKNAHDIMAKDIDDLDRALKEIVVSPGDMADFKRALLGEYETFINELAVEDRLLHRSLDDTRATIEVVRTRIEIERSRESLLLQKEGVSVQAAAGFIEFVVVGFYTLETWELLASAEVFEHIPASLRLGIDAMFATSVVAFTHYMAKFIQKEKANLGLVLAGLAAILSVVLMIMATNYSG